MKPTDRIGLMLATCIACANLAAAHDFWIEPSSFVPQPGRPLRIALRVGHRLDGAPVPRESQQIERFVAVDADGSREIPGVDGVTPAGLLRPTSAGLAMIAYQSRGVLNELPPDRFEAYLREEGLDAITILRRQRGQSDRPGRELFVRCAKALLAVGGDAAGRFDRPLGLPLEIVPEQNPSAATAGDMVDFRVLYAGRPLPDASVVVACSGGTTASTRIRTDVEGRVRIKLGATGTWFVQCVHMIETPDASDSDWRSYWASLTFAVK